MCLVKNYLLAIKNNTLEKYSIRESARLMGVSAAAPYTLSYLVIAGGGSAGAQGGGDCMCWGRDLRG